MKRVTLLVAAILASALLAGCVIVPLDGWYGGFHRGPAYGPSRGPSHGGPYYGPGPFRHRGR